MIGKPNAMEQGGVHPLVKDPTLPVARTDRPPLPGLAHITGQRIVLGADGARCTVFGRRHRLPVEQRVPLSVATALAREGVHTVVRVAEA